MALFGPDELDSIAGADPSVSGHAADCVEAAGIDAKIVKEIFPYVKAHHFAQHDNPTARNVTGVNDLKQPALHLCGRFGNTRSTNDFAGQGGEAGPPWSTWFHGVQVQFGGAVTELPYPDIKLASPHPDTAADPVMRSC